VRRIGYLLTGADAPPAPNAIDLKKRLVIPAAWPRARVLC
jgi:hypothetical protein